MQKLLYISKDNRDKELMSFFNVLSRFFDVITYSSVTNEQGLIDLYNEINPSIVLLHHNKFCFNNKLFKKLNNSYNIYWRNDERNPIESWYNEMIPYFNLFLTSSEDSSKEVIKLGVKSERLMMGFNPIKLTDEKRDFNIVFTGQNSVNKFPLSHIRKSLVSKLLKREDFFCFGKGWGIGDHTSHYSVYKKTKIGLAINHYNTEFTYSNRMYQIMTSGALCLAYRTKGLIDEFGGNIATFETYAEMIDKIDYYLNNEKERIKLAVKGMVFVDNNFTWEHQAHKLINILRNENIIT